MSAGAVIIFNDFCYVNGGASKVAIDSARALAESGVTVKFLGAVGPVCAELRHPLIDVTCLGQTELIKISAKPQSLLQGIWNFRASEAAKSILRRCRPQNAVVHVHGWTKALTSSPVREAVKAGFSVVLTLHDYFSACPNGAFFNYRKSEVCLLRALSTRCIVTHCDKRRYAHKLFRVVRGTVQASSGGLPGDISNFIVVSDLAERLMMPYLPSEARLFRLENVIGVVQGPPVRPSDSRSIVAVGRLDPEKGVDLLVRASEAAGVDITFIGDGQLRSTVERHRHCTVTGWKESGAVLESLRRARALVFPSLWHETYGLVVGEASALGVPSIVSDVTAAAERITHGRSGWIFESGNEASLASQLRKLSDDQAVDVVGRSAYTDFWNQPDTPTPQRQLKKLQDIYAAVIRNRADIATAA